MASAGARAYSGLQGHSLLKPEAIQWQALISARKLHLKNNLLNFGPN